MSKISNIVKLTDGFWKKIGGMIPAWVYEDCINHLMQNNGKNYHYRSQEYVKLKSNQMRGKDGNRSKSLKGIGIDSTDTSAVNMVLTGRTVKSLHTKATSPESLTMAFGMDKAGIILGNKRHGYDVTGLNDKNKAKIKQFILKQFNENERKELEKKVVITIG